MFFQSRDNYSGKSLFLFYWICQSKFVNRNNRLGNGRYFAENFEFRNSKNISLKRNQGHWISDGQEEQRTLSLQQGKKIWWNLEEKEFLYFFLFLCLKRIHTSGWSSRIIDQKFKLLLEIFLLFSSVIFISPSEKFEKSHWTAFLSPNSRILSMIYCLFSLILILDKSVSQKNGRRCSAVIFTGFIITHLK